MAPLRTSRYTLPSAVLGQQVTPESTGLSGRPRIPCFIGRGSRYKRISTEVRRSYVYDEALTFTGVAPFRATLTYASDQDLQTSYMVKSGADEVSRNKWNYVNSTTVEILPTEHDFTETYTFNYQSTSRTVLDVLENDDIRNNIKVGRSFGQDQYEEYSDYVIDMTFAGSITDVDALDADTGNTYTTTDIYTTTGGGTFLSAGAPANLVIPTTTGAGTGVLSIVGTSSYTHAYSRQIHLEVTLVVAPGPPNEVTLKWWSIPTSPGNANAKPSPTSHLTATEWNTVTLTDATPGVTDTTVLENGVSIVATSIANFSAGPPADTFDIYCVGAGLVEIDSTHLNTNQFVEFSTPVKGGASGSTGVITVATVPSLASFAFPGNRSVYLECIDDTVATTTFMWAIWGEGTYQDGTVVVNVIAPVTGVIGTGTSQMTLNFSGVFDDSGTVARDTFSYTAHAGHEYYEFKDDRSYALTVSAAIANSATFIYVTDTREGQSGTGVGTNISYIQPSGSTVGLPGGIRFRARNVDATNVDLVRYAATDLFECSFTCDDNVNWALNTRATETFTTDNDIYDATGVITGTAMTYYIVLAHTPVTSGIVSVTQAGVSVSYTWVTGTRYLYFASALSATTVVVYDHQGEEPAPGDLYYMTAQYLRPTTDYNAAQLFTSYATARAWLLPVETGNDLLVTLEMIKQLFQAGLKAIYMIQVLDADDDGIYTDVDFQLGIDASEFKPLIRDVVVLNHFTTLGYLLTSINSMNDPFTAKERMTWIGCPIETDVGDGSTAGTLIYYAKNTLQVYGDVAYHGTRILVAPTYVKYTLGMEDGSTTQLTVDGSFFAAYLAALTCSFSVPAQPLLRQTVGAFDEVDTFTEGQNLMLGEAGLILVTDIGANVYRIETETTTDNFANNFKYTNAMTQKHYVTDQVRQAIDAQAIGILPVSPESGAMTIKGIIASKLRDIVARGIVAKYQNDNGTERDLDLANDIWAEQDQSSPTLYHYRFSYFLLYTLERAYGVYQVDSNNLVR